ncbi:asparagine synthase (glutamine-hydrolyzing) [Lactobacillus sp. 3B(2020)]|uniref:asparagine synthase (glutamine-hydrolyzing) n=1 Tax=Lactobacillus sp. 3B(2020) TaxID=2695882 RepID=UPI0015E055D3|nr:asparagine synthase (glutamine-hydrolyzing) [Lactobacillus sp. 3B(2020)]QLL70271.1 asparagine synthase (glutamine-hydrolyzing) [Lactobacillus sp. 3B(2020)]
MCGFAGLLSSQSLSQPKNEFATVKTMNNMLVHRGPDDAGYFQDEYITMGFRRLSIIDLTAKGHQPMPYLNDRYLLTFNGEIYNYLELKKELKTEGYQFQGDSDSEVLLAAYAKYGVTVPQHLRGMFAFVIWDTEEKVLFAARDHFGIKPLYFATENDQFYYASEQKALYPILREHQFNHVALQDYMTFQYVPEPETLATSIHALEPGHYLIKRLGEKPRVQRYFNATFAPVQAREDVLVKRLRKVLIDSVKLHLRSDVPVGAFLSGGIDSSIIAAIANQYHPNLKTFSVGFERPGYSELSLAAETADHLGVENYQLTITPEEFMTTFPYFVWAMDDPLADPAAVPQFFLARLTRQHVTVALTGEGADELFAGYPIYHEPQSLRIFQKTQIINGALHWIATLMPAGMRGKSFLLRGTTPLEKRYVGDAFIFDEAQKAQFLKNYDPRHPAPQAVAKYYREVATADPLTKMQSIDLHSWLNGDLLRNADRTSMAFSLELRTPFLDRKVFQVASQIPSEMRIQNKTAKAILRKAAEGLVPVAVLKRPKLGFPVPIRHWLKDEMYDWARQIIITSPTDQFFRKAYFLKLLANHRRGKADYSRQLWTVLTFMTWYQQYVLTASEKERW